MTKNFRSALFILAAAASVASCKKSDSNMDPAVKPYTVPTTYTFSNTSYTKATAVSKMATELDAYLKLANTGSTVVALDQTKVNNMWNNTGNPFSDASLNTAGVNMKDLATDATTFKGFADSVLMYNTGAVAKQGTGGFIARGTNKIIVGPRGLEYGQGFLKGIMGGLFFKEAVRLLTEVKALRASDTTTAQAKWDEAFGYLSVPANYDSSVVYANTDVNRPLLWGGYLRERGREIQAGGIIFSAFLKGRAAIGGYDVTVRNAQADIILDKWEQLSARAGWVYATMPTASSNVGVLGTQLHALGEGSGFINAFKYRPATSKLTAANYEILRSIMAKDFYVLINQTGFTDLVTVQNILKTTYNLTN